jgi:hypothetical protein
MPPGPASPSSRGSSPARSEPPRPPAAALATGSMPPGPASPSSSSCGGPIAAWAREPEFETLITRAKPATAAAGNSSCGGLFAAWAREPEFRNTNRTGTSARGAGGLPVLGGVLLPPLLSRGACRRASVLGGDSAPPLCYPEALAGAPLSWGGTLLPPSAIPTPSLRCFLLLLDSLFFYPPESWSRSWSRKRLALQVVKSASRQRQGASRAGASALGVHACVKDRAGRQAVGA